MTIPLTAEPARAPAPLGAGDQMLSVELRESEDSAVAGGPAAGEGRKGKRDEYRCAGCHYGIVVYGPTPSCPMCGETRWQHVAWRPFSQLLDFPFSEMAYAGLGLGAGLRLRAGSESPASSVAGDEEDRGVASAWAVRSALPTEASSVSAWENEGGSVAPTTSNTRGWADGSAGQTRWHS